jgi:CDGSH-type Zn-finger protein
MSDDFGGNTIRGERVSVRTCPSGPLLVRGADLVVDAEGVEHEPTRPVVAVCLCRKSSRAPWCDGTHKAIPNY